MFHVKQWRWVDHCCSIRPNLCTPAPRLAIKKRREASSHLFVQIGTIIAGNARSFNNEMEEIWQQLLRVTDSGLESGLSGWLMADCYKQMKRTDSGT